MSTVEESTPATSGSLDVPESEGLVDEQPQPASTPFRVVALAVLVGVVILTVAYVAHWADTWHGMWAEISDAWEFRQAAQVFWAGGPLYDVHFHPGYWGYPPFGALAMTPLMPFGAEWLLRVTVVVNLVLLVGVLLLSFSRLLATVSGRARQALVLAVLVVVTVALSPVSDTLSLGQVSLALGLCVLIDSVVLPRLAPRAQGVLVGVFIAIKLTMAPFLLYYALTRQRAAAVRGVATVAVCWTVAALLRPDDTWTYVRRGLIVKVGDQIHGFDRSWYNQSLHGLVDGLPGSWPTVLWLLLALPTLAFGMVVARRAHRRGDLLAAAAVVGLTSVLISPLSWVQHAVWVVPALGVLIGDGRRTWSLLVAIAVGVVLMAPTDDFLRLGDVFTIMYVVLLGALAWLVWHPDEPRVEAAPALPVGAGG